MKHFTKKLALLSLLVGLSTSAWAQATTIYERGISTAWSSDDVAASGTNKNIWVGHFTYSETYGGLYASGSGNRSSVLTFNHTDGTLQTFDIVFYNLGNTGHANNYSYIKIGSDIEIQSNQQNQTGAVIINGNSSSISDCNLKNYNRGGDHWTIHVEVNTGKKTVTALTIVGTEMNGKSAHYTLGSETNLSSSATFDKVTIGFTRAGGTPAAALTSIEIAEEEQDLITADYTINYVYNGETIHSETNSTAVGTMLSAELPITINGQKYYAAEGATTSMEIVDGVNVLNVDLRLANEYNYSVNNNLGMTIASGSIVEGESELIAYPEYILSEGKLYKTSLRNATNDGFFQYRITPTTDNVVVTIDYVESVQNIAYFSEAENISGATPNNGYNTNIRCSNAYGAYFEDAVTVTTLPAGVYKATVQVWGNAGVTFSILAGGNTILDAATVGYLNTYNSEEFTLTEEADIIIPAAGSNGKVIDYIYIVKTGDYATVPGSIAAGKYATRIFPFTPTVPQGITFYSCAGMLEGKATTLALTEVSAPEANVPYILENTTNAEIDITQAGVDIHVNDTYSAGLLTGAFANTVITSGYVLQTQGEKQSFYKVANDNPITVPPYRAYLNYSAGVKSIGFDTTTAINTLEVLTSGAYEGIYTVDGKKLNRIEKGVNILKMADGTTRKVIVK